MNNVRDMLSIMIDTYQSNINSRMAEVINVLTIISVFFIPLSFLTGLYGMNFIYMSELQSPLSYPLLLMGMETIALVMVVY